MIRALAYYSNNLDEKIIHHSNNQGSISLEISIPNKITATIKRNDNSIDNFRCILIDDSAEILNDKQFDSFITYLKKLGIQVIMTSLRDNVKEKNLIKIS